MSLNSRGPVLWTSHWYSGKDDGTFLLGAMLRMEMPSMGIERCEQLKKMLSWQEALITRPSH